MITFQGKPVRLRVVRLRVVLSGAILLVATCFSASPVRAQRDAQAMQRVREILYDAELSARLRPYVMQRFKADVKRLAACGPGGVPMLIRQARAAPMHSLRLSLSVDALGAMRDPRGLPPLLDALEYRNLRLFAGNDRLPAAIAAFGKQAAVMLVPLARDGPAPTRRAAMDALRTIADPSSSGAFLRAVRERDRATMMLAVEGLGQLRERRAEPVLLELLEEQLTEARAAGNSARDRRCAAVIRCLATFGRKPTADRMLKLMQDVASPFRADAVRALAILKEQRAVSLLVPLLDEAPRKTGRTASSNPGAPSAPDAPSDPDAGAGSPAPPPVTLRGTAIQALAELGERAVPALLDAAANSKTRRGQGAMAALSQMGDVRAEPLLRRTLDDASLPRAIRRVAAQGLGRVASAASVEALVRASREQPPLVMNGDVTRALAAIGQPAREPLRRLLGSPQDVPRWTAIRALCEIGDERDLNELSAEIVRPRNANATALKSYLALARMFPTARVDETLWAISRSPSVFAVQAQEVLSERTRGDTNRLARLADQTLAKSKYAWQRTILLRVLGRTGIPGNSQNVQHLLDSQQSDVRQAAAAVLAQHNMPLLVARLRKQPLSPEDALKMQQSLEALRPYRQSQTARRAVLEALRLPALTSTALAILRDWKWRGSADALLALIADPSRSRLAPRAVATMAAMKDRRAIEAVIQHAPDFSSIQSLAQFGQEATEPLISILEDHPVAVIRALDVIGDRRAVKPLIDLLDRKQHGGVHHLAVIALGNIIAIGNPGALGNPPAEPATAESASVESAADVLVKRLEEPGRVSPHFIVESIQKLPRPVVIPRIAPLLNKPKLELTAVLILDAIGTPAAYDALRRHLPSVGSKASREAIRRALGRAGEQP